jgi:predicted Zn-dependent protease
MKASIPISGWPAATAGVCLILLLAACGAGEDSRAQPTATPAEEDLRHELDKARDRFAEVETHRIRTHVGGARSVANLEMDGGYRDGETEYVRGTVTFAFDDQEITEEWLFLPPTLYYQDDEDAWWVLSPWNQGVRPGEDQGMFFEKPFIDFDTLSAELKELERSDVLLDGHAALKYEGVVPDTAISALEQDAEQGDETDIELWIDAATFLPLRVEFRVGGDAVRVEYLDIDTEIVVPEAPSGARPFRDAELPDAACIGDAYAACLPAQEAIIGSPSCDGDGKRVCLVPLGQISPQLVQHLVERYAEQYDIEVTVLTPTAIPLEFADPLRQQVDASGLIDYMGSVFPEAHADPDVTLIGLTIVDLYDATSHFRYVFGVKGSPSDPRAVVSNFRMNPETYSEPANEELLFARTRKLVFKYIGLLHLKLQPSDDPTSPMFDSILGPDDLDRMGEALPIR